MVEKEKDIVERLRVAPVITLDHNQVREGAQIRQMMVERAEAAHEIERLRARLAKLETRQLGQERGTRSGYNFQVDDTAHISGKK